MRVRTGPTSLQRRARRPVLVGRAPGPQANQCGPLSGRAGTVLAGCAGMRRDAFLTAFNRVNVFPRWPGPAPGGTGDAFPPREARERARRMLLVGQPLVFLGEAVAQAFGFREEVFAWGLCRSKMAVTIPHPSGLNRRYNDPDVRDRVGDVLRRALELAGQRRRS